jgi:hypothetical protein
VNNGGCDLNDFAKRNMNFLLGDELPCKFNVTGRSRKRAFKPLSLFEFICGKLYSNLLLVKLRADYRRLYE